MAGTDREPSELEQRLIDAVEQGELLDLAGDGPIDEAAKRSWGPDRTVRSWVLRDILRGRLAPDPDPHGLRLRGARITGRLDLENVTSDLELALSDCFLPDGPVLRDARLRAANFSACVIGQPIGATRAPVDAARFTARVMRFRACRVEADSPNAAVELHGAHIGLLDCTGAELSNTGGIALHADRLTVDQGLFLRDGFTATGTGEQSTIRLPSAQIGGQLTFNGAQISNINGPALHADGLQVEGDIFLNDGFTAAGTGERGTIRLIGAHVAGQLTCVGGQVHNTAGLALEADGLQVEHGMFLRDGFTATGSSERGTIRLIGAHIGRLDCTGAQVRNDAGPALAADGLQIDHGLILGDGFTATGCGELGTIRLIGARVGGQLNCTGAQLCNTAGPALTADGLHVDLDVFFREGFTATGTGEWGVVRLPGAHIGGQLVLETGDITAEGGPLVNVDGMTYTELPRPNELSYWLRLLRRHTPAYAAQPYQQLAAVHRAAGHDHDVRHVLMAQRDDQIHRKAIHGWDLAWARVTGAVLGYGYQPWRALIGLLLVLTLSLSWTWTAAHHHGLAHTARTPNPGTACTVTELVGVALDLGTPLLKTGARDICSPTTSRAGQRLTIASWPLQALAWALAALFIAGFTSAVRKT